MPGQRVRELMRQARHVHRSTSSRWVGSTIGTSALSPVKMTVGDGSMGISLTLAGRSDLGSFA